MNGDILLLKHEFGYMIRRSVHGTKVALLKHYISIIKEPEIKMSVVKIVDHKINYLTSPSRVESLPTNIQRYEWKFKAAHETRNQTHGQKKQRKRPQKTDMRDWFSWVL